MAYKKITYSAQCKSTWPEPSVMSWSAWLGLGTRQCLSGYISKCGYEIIPRPSDFFFSNICIVSGGLSNWDQKLSEEQKPKHSWHFRRYKMESDRDEAKQEADQDLLLIHCRKCCQEHEEM